MSEAATVAQAVVWTELRDERGKLCARIDGRLLLLEVRRNHETVIFDLREYVVYLPRLEMSTDIE